ncbi:MAG: archease, partial [Dehalococcoidia bacterium]|nr:archease [Dehalococcoidia bacterium]
MRRIVEHTADAGIEVEANSLPEAFEEIGKAFTEIVTGGSLTESNNINSITINANTLDSLL